MDCTSPTTASVAMPNGAPGAPPGATRPGALNALVLTSTVPAPRSRPVLTNVPPSTVSVRPAETVRSTLLVKLGFVPDWTNVRSPPAISNASSF